MIFGVVNEYQDVYVDLDELKSDLVGGYVRKRLKLELRNRPKTGATFGINWYCWTH